MSRIDKINYYLNIAETVAKRGTCLRRNYGSVIVKDDVVISTGYTGAPRGRKNCCDIGTCIREEMNIPRGTHYELCRSVHSEMNAIINADKDKMNGATLYLVGLDYKTGKIVENANSCSLCKRMIINAGIKKVVVRIPKIEGIPGVQHLSDPYIIHEVSDWIKNDESLSGKEGY